MAGTFAQCCIDTGNEAIQHIHGHEGLDSAGKATAVDTVSTPAVQIMFAESQADSHILMGFVAGGNDVLQIHVGGVAALLDQLQEAVEVACFQSSYLLGNPVIFLVEVDSALLFPVFDPLRPFAVDSSGKKKGKAPGKSAGF